MSGHLCLVCGNVQAADACVCILKFTNADLALLERPYVPQVPIKAEASDWSAPARDPSPTTPPPPPANHAPAPAAQVPVTQTPAPQTDPGDGAGESATHPVVAMDAAARSNAADDVPADVARRRAGGLNGFAFRDTPDTHGEPPGQAGRRAEQRGRGHLMTLTAGAGILALGVGAAFASGPRWDNRHAALPPLPSSTPDAMPSDTSTGATPTTAPPASPTVTPSQTSPHPTRVAPATESPVTTAQPAPPAPAPATPSGAPSASPTPSPTARTLQMGHQGQDVADMQQLRKGQAGARSADTDGQEGG